MQVVAVGITNQRETTLVWDRATGRPLHNAIVWLDTRTAALCERLTKQLGSQARCCVHPTCPCSAHHCRAEGISAVAM